MKPQRKANLTRIFHTSQEDIQEANQCNKRCPHKEKNEKLPLAGKRSLVTLS